MISMRLLFIICISLVLLSTLLTIVPSHVNFDLQTVASISIIAAAITSTLIIVLERKRIGYKWFVQNNPVEKDNELMGFLKIDRMVPAKNYVLVENRGRMMGHAYARITDVPYLIDDLDRQKKIWYVGNFARILSTLTFTFEIIPRISPVSAEAYLHSIQREIENLQLTISAEGSTANPKREARLKHLEKLSARLLDGEGARDVGFLAHVIVEGRNEAEIVKELDSNIKTMISALESGLGVRAERLEGYQMLEAIQEFFRASGTNHPSNPCRLLSWDIAYLIPFTRPKVPPASKLLSGVYLGRTNTGSIACLDLKRYANPHIAVLGKSGFGKSTTVKTFISRLHDLTGTPILVIDYAGEYLDWITSRSGTIIDMRKDRINPFELGGALLVDRIRQVVDAFTKTCDLKTINQRNAFAKYVTEAYRVRGFRLNDPQTWNSEPPTLADVIKLMEKDLKRAPALKQLTIQSVIARLQVLASGPFGIFGHSTVSIDQLTQGLTCIDLSKVTSNNLKDLIAWTILQYLDMMMRVDGVRTDVRLLIVIDEAWKLCKDADCLPVTIVKEGRKYGYSLCVSTQDIIDLAEPILSNAGTVIIHRTEHPRYLNFFEKAYDLTELEISKIKNLPIGEALIKINIDSKPFFVSVDMEKPETSKTSGKPQQSNQRIYHDETEKVRLPSEQLEKIMPSTGLDLCGLGENEKRILKIIAEEAVYSTHECYEKAGLNRYQGNKAKKELLKKGLIHILRLPTTGKGRRPEGLELTEKGVAEAENLGFKVKMAGRKGGLLHRHLIDLATKEFQRYGCKVETEYPTTEDRSIDLVVNDKLAVEVETGQSDITSNVNKILKFEEALIICANSTVEHAVERTLSALTQEENIRVVQIGQLPDFIRHFQLHCPRREKSKQGLVVAKS